MVVQEHLEGSDGTGVVLLVHEQFLHLLADVPEAQLA